MKKIGVIILCRYNSSRLPGKILLPIGNQPILMHICNQVKIQTDNFCIATSDAHTDDPIINYCKENQIPFFRGSLENVALRFKEAAQCFNYNYAIRINGDNLFVNHNILNECLNNYQRTNFDLVTNVIGRTFPYGMSVEMLNMQTFDKYLPHFNEFHQQHVTSYIYENEEKFKIIKLLNIEYPGAQGLKMAVDTPKDYIFLKELAKQMAYNFTNYNFAELIEKCNKLKSNL
ncbi:MAG TPA: hypothetical protein P5235_07115 [Saprospiraceae bacterium]|nr:hypothetical protein [Lewinellaceae bacterium]HRX29140.1 hypothetical protein [Saprospiraceae bacterium]